LNKISRRVVRDYVMWKFAGKHILRLYSYWRSPPHQMFVPVLPGEPIPEVSGLLPVLMKLYVTLHRLRHRFHRVRMRAYRVIATDRVKYERLLVYEDADRGRFRDASSSSGPAFWPDWMQICDLGDAAEAIRHLLDSTLPSEWDDCPDSIDKAVDPRGGWTRRAIEEMERELPESTGQDDEVIPDSRGRDSQWAGPDLETQMEWKSEIPRLYEEICSTASAKEVHWKSVERVAGFECQVLIIDGNDVHETRPYGRKPILGKAV